MNNWIQRLAASIAIAASFVVLYWSVLVKLVHDWATDDNYSHGFVVVPLAAYFVWERRQRLAALQPQPHWAGLVIIIGSLMVLLAGILGAELFLSRVSMIGMLAGIVLFVLGWPHLRASLFPLLFLLLMIPIPAIIFNQIAFPLQLLASRAGEQVLHAASIPVLREGNVIILAAMQLEVAEACSGIRSLVSLLTLGIIYGYFTDRRLSVRTLLALVTVPIAILTNALRVAGTGIAAHYYGPRAAEGLTHEMAGWLVFVAAFLLLFGVGALVQRLLPQRDSQQEAMSVTAWRQA